MNKYTELSDDAINAMVFISLYGRDSLKDKDMRRYFSRVDYCNNPSDAMSIIIENRIALTPISSACEWVCSHRHFRAINKNPLRAAMEVFLMMRNEEDNND